MAVDQLILELVTKGFERAKKQFKEVDKAMEKIGKDMQKLQASLLGLGLAFLFTGMAIKKFFGDLLKSAFNTYQTIVGDNNILIQKTGELQAAWEFFKFSLVDALSQSDLFILIIDTIISIVNWFNNLSETSKKVLGLMLIGITVLGTAMMVFGMTLLFINGIVGALSSSIGVMLLGAVIGIIVVIGTIIALFLIWNSNLTTTEKVLLTIAIALAAVLAILGILGISIGLIASLWILSIIAVSVVLALLINKYGSLKNVVLEFGQIFLAVSARIGSAVAEFLIRPIQAFLELLIRLVNFMNTQLGFSIDTSSLVKIGDALNKLTNVPIDMATAGIDYLEGLKDVNEPTAPEGDMKTQIKEGFSEALSELGSDFFTGTFINTPTTNP